MNRSACPDQTSNTFSGTRPFPRKGKSQNSWFETWPLRGHTRFTPKTPYPYSSSPPFGSVTVKNWSFIEIAFCPADASSSQIKFNRKDSRCPSLLHIQFFSRPRRSQFFLSLLATQIAAELCSSGNRLQFEICSRNHRRNHSPSSYRICY